MTHSTSRRKFLASGAMAAVAIVDRRVLGAPFVPPSERTTFAQIGMGTQGFRELPYLLDEPRIQITAVCDPNKDSQDYVDWGKDSVRNVIRRLLQQPSWREGASGIPGGREIGRQVVDTYYANQRSGKAFKACACYADFRELLEKEKDVDAVKIMTPDHLHAAVSIAALNKGKHVLVHKPLANRLYEGRLVLETARKTKLNTHFLPYNNSGESIRLIHGWIKDGAIGRLRSVHNWSNRPVWPQFPSLPTETPPVPEGFDWALWLGPSLDRPYHPNYTHAVFRGWYEFGGGSLADMGHYSLWSVFTEFGLAAPKSVQAWSSHTCTIVDQVSRRLHNDVSFPAANTVRFQFPALADRPAPDIYWYDGGMKPPWPEELDEDHGDEDHGDLSREGMMFVGEDGKILAGFRGQDPRIIPQRRMREYLQSRRTAPPEGDAPRRRGSAHWLDAFRGGPPSPGDFLNAGPITEAVNLAGVAMRVGGKIDYDCQNMKITNRPEANQYLCREYRKGWEL